MTIPEPDPDGMPPAATYRAIQEILATFARSGWTGMELEVRGVRVAVGRHGPPVPARAPDRGPAASASPPAPAPVAAPAPAVPSARGEPSVAPGDGSFPSQAPPAPPTDRTGLVAVRSPAVGAFWVAPSPGQPPFVAVGDHVGENAQLAIVEVMKLMNPVVTTTAGEVVEVCAANADLVEYEQVLFWLRPDE